MTAKGRSQNRPFFPARPIWASRAASPRAHLRPSNRGSEAASERTAAAPTGAIPSPLSPLDPRVVVAVRIREPWHPVVELALQLLPRPHELGERTGVRERGHPVTSLAFSSTGERLAAGYASGSIEAWSVADGRSLFRTGQSPGSSVLSVDFDRTGRRLLSGAQTRRLGSGTRTAAGSSTPFAGMPRASTMRHSTRTAGGSSRRGGRSQVSGTAPAGSGCSSCRATRAACLLRPSTRPGCASWPSAPTARSGRTPATSAPVFPGCCASRSNESRPRGES
jgi:hypothetical protein